MASRCVRCTQEAQTKCDHCELPICAPCFEAHTPNGKCVGAFMDYHDSTLHECVAKLWRLIGGRNVTTNTKEELIGCARTAVELMSTLLPEEKRALRRILPIEGVIKLDYVEMGGGYLAEPTQWLVFELDTDRYPWGFKYNAVKMAGILIGVLYGIVLARWLYHRSTSEKVYDREAAFEKLDIFLHKLQKAGNSAEVRALVGQKKMMTRLGPLFKKFLK